MFFIVSCHKPLMGQLLCGLQYEWFIVSDMTNIVPDNGNQLDECQIVHSSFHMRKQAW